MWIYNFNQLAGFYHQLKEGVQTPNNLRVSDLLTNRQRLWDSKRVRNLFLEDTSPQIFQLQISNSNHDFMIWVSNELGKFSSKSALKTIIHNAIIATTTSTNPNII